jgi:hypothetical protein
LAAHSAGWGWTSLAGVVGFFGALFLITLLGYDLNQWVALIVHTNSLWFSPLCVDKSSSLGVCVFFCAFLRLVLPVWGNMVTMRHGCLILHCPNKFFWRIFCQEKVAKFPVIP